VSIPKPEWHKPRRVAITVGEKAGVIDGGASEAA
jgi:hypothetical protein